MKRASPERAIHLDVLAYMRCVLPAAITHHSAQGLDVSDNGAGNVIARAVAKAKCMGMVTGFPDLILLHRGRAYGMEIKAEGGRMSLAQKAVQGDFAAAGVPYAVVRSVDDARDALADWGIATREVTP